MMDDSTKQAISEAGLRAFGTIEKVFLARLYREPTCIDAFLVLEYMQNLIGGENNGASATDSRR